MQHSLLRPATRAELTRTKLLLEERVRSLTDKVQCLEELHHMMAHNLRGPAQNLRSLIEVMKDAHAEKSPQLEKITTECIALMESAGTKMLENLDVLLQSAMIGLDKKIVYDQCDVAHEINNICSQLNSSIQDKHAFIHQSLYLSHIACPKNYFTSILYNLVSNALKYSRDEVPTQISISTRLKMGVAVLEVKDNGIGIDLESYGEKIFKLNQYFHEGYDSKGVGLYMTRTQVESIGGRITVVSTPREGSLFTVYFPVML